MSLNWNRKSMGKRQINPILPVYSPHFQATFPGGRFGIFCFLVRARRKGGVRGSSGVGFIERHPSVLKIEGGVASDEEVRVRCTGVRKCLRRGWRAKFFFGGRNFHQALRVLVDLTCSAMENGKCACLEVSAPTTNLAARNASKPKMMKLWYFSPHNRAQSWKRSWTWVPGDFWSQGQTIKSESKTSWKSRKELTFHFSTLLNSGFNFSTLGPPGPRNSYSTPFPTSGQNISSVGTEGSQL